MIEPSNARPGDPSMLRFPRIAFLCILLAPALGAEIRDPMKGQRLFVSKRCVDCHAVRGNGGRIGPDLGRTAVKGSFYELVSAMWNHTQVMGEKMEESRLVRPAFANEELGDLLAFLAFLNYFDEPGNPKIGKALFSQKHCIQCHRVGREGGSSAPPLDRIPRGTPPLQLARDLWNHGPVMVPLMKSKGLAVPSFNENEILNLFAFLRSQGPRQKTRDFRSAGDPIKGKALFMAKGCAQCHSFYGKGGAGMGPDLGRADLRGSVTLLAGRMWNHWRGMTAAMESHGMATPKFQKEELADLFAFIVVTRYDGPLADKAKGRNAYIQKGCSTCHGMDGRGGIGPGLRKVTTGESRERIAQRMWNHAPQMGVSMGSRQIPWPRFEASELAGLLAFLSDEWKEPKASTVK